MPKYAAGCCILIKTYLNRLQKLLCLCFYIQLCFHLHTIMFPFICVLQIKCLNANEVRICKTSDGENVLAGNNMTFRSTNSILFMSPIKNSDHCYRCNISATNKGVQKINCLINELIKQLIQIDAICHILFHTILFITLCIISIAVNLIFTDPVVFRVTWHPALRK